jgi:small GTP-binding protein
VSNNQIRVNFYDTAGQERFNAITKAHYRRAMGALVCFSVSDKDSFSALPRWVEEVQENAAPDCTCVLIGTKSDVEEHER